MITIQELRSSTKKELFLELQKARKEALKVRISLKTKHEKDTSKASKTKRHVARVLLALQELNVEESKKAASKKA
jgi:ribosomal protein L29